MPASFIKSVFFYATAAVILSPLILLSINAFSQESAVFSFLVKNILDDVVLNSLVITSITAIGVLGIGLSTAWLTTRYEFFGSSILRWMLLFPLAFPSYILAYAYTDFFDVGGAVYQFLTPYGWQGFIPEMRTIGGACFVLIFCLYPYIYIFARNGFESGSQSQMEAAHILGASRAQQFFNIALPAARPFIIVGLMLVIMETLADYGTMAYFGIRVFSTGIYDAWAGYGDTIAAARLAIILLFFILAIVGFEKFNRRKMRFFTLETLQNTLPNRQYLKGLKSFIVSLFCFLPVFFGFILPIIILGRLTAQNITITLWQNTLPFLMNSFMLAFIVAIIGVVLSFALISIKRNKDTQVIRFLYQICGFGYALPGIVLGLGLLFLSSVFKDMNFLIHYAVMFLIIGYLIRFLAISLQTVEAGFDKISPSIYQASKLMRNNIFVDFWQVKRPLITPAFLSAGLLLFVEVVKELPLTLMLRPFDFDTLAIRAYHLASDERLAEAALPALMIVLIGCLPIVLLHRLQKR